MGEYQNLVHNPKIITAQHLNLHKTGEDPNKGKFDKRYGINFARVNALTGQQRDQFDTIRNYAWQWSVTHAEPYKIGTPQRKLWMNTKLRNHIGRRFAVFHYQAVDGPLDETVRTLINDMKSM